MTMLSEDYLCDFTESLTKLLRVMLRYLIRMGLSHPGERND